MIKREFTLLNKIYKRIRDTERARKIHTQSIKKGQRGRTERKDREKGQRERTERK